MCILPGVIFIFTIPMQQQCLSEENTWTKKYQLDGQQTIKLASAKQKHVQRSQIQFSHYTSLNRYPDEYGAVKEYLENLFSKEEGKSSRNHKSKSDIVQKKTKKSLLSFGSSTGEEAITLATMYFNDTQFNIFGVDLDQVSIDKAKASVLTQDPKLEDGKVQFFNGNDVNISEYGPYDAIFANSVLCLHGITGLSAESVVEHFSFSDFETVLVYLDANLKVGGVLAIVNTNYHFSHAEDLYKKYRPISTCIGNDVPKVDVKNFTFEKHVRVLDCVWVKESS